VKGASARKKRHSVAATHRAYSADWWTPPEWVRWVRDTLKCEPFDPCPCDWSPSSEFSGLDHRWESPAYVNHPGAKARGAAQRWWDKYLEEQGKHHGRLEIVWCAFSVEQLRQLRPSPLELPGWLVMPRTRTAFVWGGPTKGTRIHDQIAKSPSNWAIWWTNVEPATPPVESLIVRTA